MRPRSFPERGRYISWAVHPSSAQLGGDRHRRTLVDRATAPQYYGSERVETGSFNWTTSASSYNYENAIFISDPEVAARYKTEFQHLWAQAR